MSLSRLQWITETQDGTSCLCEMKASMRCEMKVVFTVLPSAHWAGDIRSIDKIRSFGTPCNDIHHGGVTQII